MSFRADSSAPTRTVFVLVSLLIGGCDSSVPPPDRVAEIDGQPTSYMEFESFLQDNSADTTGVLGSDVLSSLLDQYLDEQLLRRLAAERLGLEKELGGRAAAEALLKAADLEPEVGAIADYYRQNLPQFDLPERVELRQLLFIDRATAERIRELWSLGTAFATIGEELADDSTAHVGEAGEFSRQDLPPVFAEVLFGLAEGEISEVLPADYGFHVFQVTRQLEAGVIPLQEASAGIREALMSRMREEVLSRLAAEARQRYNVRVFERNLPFNYLGRYGTDSTHENT